MDPTGHCEGAHTTHGTVDVLFLHMCGACHRSTKDGDGRAVFENDFWPTVDDMAQPEFAG